MLPVFFLCGQILGGSGGCELCPLGRPACVGWGVGMPGCAWRFTGTAGSLNSWTCHPPLPMRKLTRWLRDSHSQCLGELGASFPTPSCPVSYHPGSKDGSSSSHAGVTSAAGAGVGEVGGWDQEGRGWGLKWTGQSRPGSSPRARAWHSLVRVVSLMWPQAWIHKSSVQQGFWSAVLVRSTRPGFWATELLGTTLQ